MADDDLIDLEPELGDEQDFIFRSQMRVYEFLVSRWKELTSVIGVVLLGVLSFGLWENHHRDQQREGHAQIAAVVQ